MSRLQEESSVLGVASTSQESPSLMESEKLRVTLLGSEWSSSKGGLSTINRELAIQLAKHPNVDVSVYLPSCSDEDRRAASSHKVQLIEAQESPGFDQPIDWLVSLPNGHYPHCVIGHGVHLGRQIPHIQKQQPCKWIQVVHTAPEELGMFKSYEEAISRGEKKHRAEVQLCELADEVVAIGPKLADAYSGYLRFCKKDQHVFNLTPSIFTEFSNIEQALEERKNFCVLVFGRGDHEDFELKGYDIAMEAIAQMEDKSYQLKFVGAPKGKEEEVVSKLLQYGIPRSQLTVRCFKEDREQLANLFCEADLAIMPSRTEGFGLTGLEALSAGLPVLVSGNSGLGQALEEVPFGSPCVIHSEDPKTWADAIRVIRQKKRTVRLKEATLLREAYAANYSWQRQCESLVEKMANLISVDPVTRQPLAASEENESSTTIAVQQEGWSEQVIRNLQQWQQNASKCKISSNTDRLSDLKKIALQKGYRISDNPGSGNCMFYALSEQLEIVRGERIHHFELRRSLVQYLREHPKQVDGTDLFHFVDRHSTWNVYLTDMEQDGTWGDHVILWAAANCYQIAIHVISSLPGQSEVIIKPDCPFNQRKHLVLGHVHEVHYVSLQPLQDGELNITVDAEKWKLKETNMQTTARAVSPTEGSASYSGTEDSPAQRVLCSIALNYLKTIPPQSREEYNIFMEYLREIKVIIKDAREGSLVITVKCESLQSLEKLWTDYSSGHLGEMVQNCFVTEKILKEHNLTELRLKTTMDREEYNATKVYFERVALREIRETIPGRDERSASVSADQPCKQLKEELTTDDYSKDAVVNKSRQASNEKVKRSSSFAATQSVKRLKGSDHCLIVEHLESEYIRRSNVKPLLWDGDIQLPIDEVYTRLQMKWRKKAYFQLTEKEVHMYEIFKPARKGEKGARMVLVEGNPGIGKTTFCLKIASDWAKKLVPVEFHFPMFELLFLLKCCDIHKGTKDIVQAIDEQLLNDDINNKEEFLDYIRDGKNQDKILLILDGLDELPKKSKKVLDRLFRRKVFSRCFILVTSREEKGIDVRRRYDFDTLLQIKGFTSEEAADYIRKHFKSVDPKNLSKGERLIEAVETNTYLDALRNNPLNLLLLCVVFEDFEGELPSNRTKLYQIIFRCLLRRYCSRNGLNFHRNADEALENQFKESLLVLGELAWNCLREDRRSFSEEELYKLEHSRTHVRRFPAIKLGFVFMEASSRPSQEPRHQCHFLHKTFQEFLAAFYLANQMLTEQLSLTDHSDFCRESMLRRDRQVFFFVAGILGTKGTVFFEEIVTILGEDWEWETFGECEFLLDLLEESGAADYLGKVIYSRIPLPNGLKFNGGSLPFLKLIRYALEGKVASAPLTKLHLSNVQDFSRDNLNDLQRILESSQTLTELVICNIENMSPDDADLFAVSLSSSTSLRKVTLKLFDVRTEKCASNVSTLLSTFSQLKCVVLEVFGVLNNTVAQAVKALFKSSLISLAFTVHGDQDDRLMSTISEGLAEETAVESLSLVVHGRLSNPGIIALQKGALRNRTLHSLELQVYGDIPEAWVAAVANILAANKSWNSLIIHPNVYGKIKHEANLLPYPILGNASLKKSLTMNVCGELSVRSLKALGDFFTKSSPLSGLQLNVQGKLGNDVVDHLVDYFLANNSLPSHSSIHLRGEIRSYEETALQRLVQEGQKHSVSVYLNSLGEDHLLSGDTLANFSSASDTFLVDGTAATHLQVKKQLSSASSTTFNLTVDHHAAVWGDWASFVGDGLANSTSLTTFSLTINNHVEDKGFWASDVGNGLAKSRSLTTFSLTVNNHAEDMGDWASGVGNGLEKSSSMTTFSLTINNHDKDMGDWASGVGNGLAKSTSLTTFSLTVNNPAGDMGYWASGVGDGLANSSSLTTFSLAVKNPAEDMGDWASGVSNGLAKSSSLTTFSLTVNHHAEDMEDWASGVSDGLANSISLTTFSLTVNHHAEGTGDWASSVGDGLAKSSSLTTFSLTVNNYVDYIGEWARGVGDGLANSRSLTTFSLTVNNHAIDKGIWDSGMGNDWANSRSLTTFSLTVNNYAEDMGDWGSGVGDGLANSTSLTTFSLTVNNHGGDDGHWASGLSAGLAKSSSLTTFSLTVNNHAEHTRDWAGGVGYGLAKSSSLTTFSLRVNNYADYIGDWATGVGYGLAQSGSLTTFSLEVNHHAKDMGHWAGDVGDGLAKSTSLTTFSLTVNNHAEDMGHWASGVGNGLAKSTSLTTFSLTVNNHAEDMGHWVNGLGHGLANSSSLTTFSLTVNNHADEIGRWTNDLSKGLAENCSLTTIRVTFNLYGENRIR